MHKIKFVSRYSFLVCLIFLQTNRPTNNKKNKIFTPPPKALAIKTHPMPENIKKKTSLSVSKLNYKKTFLYDNRSKNISG